MWLAHALTLSRIPLAIALWVVWGDPLRAAAIVAVAALTDVADGRVARRAKQRGAAGPDIGGWLDPAADKVFVAVVLAAIWVHRDSLDHPLAVIALVGAREIVLVPLIAIYVARRVPHPPMSADRLGKAATVAQLIALCVIVIASHAPPASLAPRAALPVAVVAAGFGLAAAVHYVVVAISQQRSSVAGRET